MVHIWLIYGSYMVNLWLMVIEIVDLPIENGGSFHSYVNVYQRVHQCKSSMSIHVIYGMSSFPVTNSIIFQRAGEKQPDNFLGYLWPSEIYSWFKMINLSNQKGDCSHYLTMTVVGISHDLWSRACEKMGTPICP